MKLWINAINCCLKINSGISTAGACSEATQEPSPPDSLALKELKEQLEELNH